MLARSPLKSPLGFFLDTRNGMNGLKEMLFAHSILDLGINQQWIDLTVNVLHGDLKALEAAGLGQGDFA